MYNSTALDDHKSDCILSPHIITKWATILRHLQKRFHLQETTTVTMLSLRMCHH